MSEVELTGASFIKPSEYTLAWKISEHITLNQVVKKNWYNRWKWWIATKLFLPGSYKWLI